MVAHPAHHRAVAAGRDSDFHRQLRHRLGALSVPVIYGRAAQYPRHFCVLPRLSRRAGNGWQYHFRRAGGALHAQERRFRLPASRCRILSPPRELGTGAT